MIGDKSEKFQAWYTYRKETGYKRKESNISKENKLSCVYTINIIIFITYPLVNNEWVKPNS